MEYETINRLIHEKVMGRCWHEGNPASIKIGLRWVPCVKCRENIRAWDDEPNPDYCSDLNAVREAELRVIWKEDAKTLKNALVQQMDLDDCEVFATAEQRARAILKALDIRK